MVHGDGNTRQCMATAAVAYKQSFGFDAPPYTYRDFEESDVIVLVGSNLCIAHPIMWERICKNPNTPAIVVDRSAQDRDGDGRHASRRASARSRDLTLLYGDRATCSIERGWVDRAFVDAHTTGFDELRGARGAVHARRASSSETGRLRGDASTSSPS